MNNYEYITSINNIDELVEWLHSHGSCIYCVFADTECNEEIGCYGGIKRWLEKEK